MMDRRRFLGITAGAGASLALSPQLLRALGQPHGGELIQRAIPSSGELLPAVGLSFSNHPACSDHGALTQVLEAFAEGGGRVYDAMHVDPASEQFHITAARELGIQHRLFWSTRGTRPGAAPPGSTAVTEHIDSLLARIGVPRLDLVLLPVAADPTHLAALKEAKKAGRVRYIGVQTIIAGSQSARLMDLMRTEPLDFVGVDYDVANRGVESGVLPLARERGIGVMAFFPFGNAGGLSCTGSTSLFSRTANRPLPQWAADFDATTWAQFFIKYVISHPAITIARVGTRKVNHMIDNLGGGVGRLPDQAARERMAALIDALPPAPRPAQQTPAGPPIVLSAAVLDRYVGEYRTAAGASLTVRRYGTTLVVKGGTRPDTVAYPLSETRFSWRPDTIEFQRDSAGTVTGLVIEQGERKIHASRIR